MTLTAQQEKFCQAIADGMTQADAYRTAYKAGNMKDEVIYVKASELAKDGKVAVRVSELKSVLADAALWTRQDSVKTLKQIAEALGSDSKPNEVVAAVKELNAMHGFNEPVKLDISGKIVHGILKVPPKNV
jgi:phage terminase small subunit